MEKPYLLELLYITLYVIWIWHTGWTHRGLNVTDPLRRMHDAEDTGTDGSPSINCNGWSSISKHPLSPRWMSRKLIRNEKWKFVFISLTTPSSVVISLGKIDALAGMSVTLLYSIPSVLHVHLAFLQHAVNVPRDRQECLFYVLSSYGWRLQKAHRVEVGEVLSFLHGHRSGGISVCLE